MYCTYKSTIGKPNWNELTQMNGMNGPKRMRAIGKKVQMRKKERNECVRNSLVCIWNEKKIHEKALDRARRNYTTRYCFFPSCSSLSVNLNIVLYWLKNGACAICTLIDANHRFLYAYVANAQARIVFLLHCKFNQHQRHHHDIYLYATDNYQNVPFTICIYYLYSIFWGVPSALHQIPKKSVCHFTHTPGPNLRFKTLNEMNSTLFTLHPKIQTIQFDE